jgi:NADPH:quinone reductase-like Zn-dependent oxidoreductase
MRAMVRLGPDAICAREGEMPIEVRVMKRGGPEVMRVVEVPLPEPRRGEVRLRVLAAGVAFGDVTRRRLPVPRTFVPGYDVVGRVEAYGPGVDVSAAEGYVAAFMPRPGTGGYAEHVCILATHVVPVPEEVPPAHAVALGLNYVTAHQLLERIAPPPEGGSILVHGASGGVGTAMLQLARRKRLRVLGTASAAKHGVVRELGAEPIDYRSGDWLARTLELVPGGVDVAYDPIGGGHAARSRRAVRRGGTVVAFGLTADVQEGGIAVLRGVLRYAGAKLRPDGRRSRLYAITVSKGARPADCRRDWSTLLDLYLAGEVRPIIGAELPLEEAAEAHRMLEAGEVTGKIVLVPRAS